MAALLEADGITKAFGGLMAVHDVSMLLEEGTIVSLIGPNGAGKTTLFNIIAGLYRPTSGTLRFAGQSLIGRKPHRITALGIARTFQNIRLFTNMTAVENVLVGMHSRLTTGLLGAIFRPGSVVREEERALVRAEELLDLVGLSVRHEYAGSLPYGMQRRLEIARALAANPRLLLLDEPTAGMNPQETAAMMRLISGLRSDLKVSILLIEHDMRVVMGVSDRVVVLDHGVKIADDTPAEVRRDPRVIEAYLGRKVGAA